MGLGARQPADLRRRELLGRAFLVVSVAFLALLAFAFYQDLSRPWAPIQEKYAAQYGQDFPIQVQQLFPKVQVNGQFLVERCITCHVPDIAKIGPQEAAKRLGPNHPSVISDAIFAKYGQDTLICRPGAAVPPSASPSATASPSAKVSRAATAKATPQGHALPKPPSLGVAFPRAPRRRAHHRGLLPRSPGPAFLRTR